ncbi:MAG: hypothetical protein QOI73_3295 [Solirubrobacteraceae bacterium]|nr:hypothetical protein [Solirubrobacteraceae bacterium]
MDEERAALDWEDRVRGSLMASAAGDALGWPIEPRGQRVGGTRELKPQARFIPWTRRDGGRWAPHEEDIPEGTYSDDTQLTIAVARSVRYDDWWWHFVSVELPVWLLYDMGGGGAVRRAAQSWRKGKPPWMGTDKEVSSYYSAGANGVAMRIAPHCFQAGPGGRFESVRAAVLRNGLATHGHPRALVGAQLFAYACSLALGRSRPLGFGELVSGCISGVHEWALFEPHAVPPEWFPPDDSGYFEQWSRTVEECLGLLDACRQGLSRGALAVDHAVLKELGVFSKQGGAGTISAAASIFLASRHASHPHSGLLSAAFARNADADTLAAMTGTLLGAVHGSSWLGDLSTEVQDARYLSALAHELALGRLGDLPSEEPWRASAASEVFALLAEHQESGLALPALGQLRIRSATRHKTKAAQRIQSWWLDTEEGQSIRIKRTVRLDESRAEQQEAPVGPPTMRPVIAGYIQQVTDLRRAVTFYRDLIGLELMRSNGTSASFGWLALEEVEPGERLRLASDSNSGAVTVVLDPESFRDMAQRLKRECVPILSSGERRGRRVMVCADPDGNPIEFRQRQRSSPAASASGGNGGLTYR